MILYFSGTGNSAYVAKKIAEQTKEEVYSINDFMIQKKFFTQTEEDKLIFVVPTYAWRIPKVAEQWILRSSFMENVKTYFVMSCGGQIGNAGKYAKKLCTKKKLRYMGCAQVIMPENYIAMFSAPDEDTAKKVIDKADATIDKIAEIIKWKQTLEEEKTGVKDKILSGPVNVVFYPAFVHAKQFYADDRCISCGKCERICPLHNIKLTGGKPEWADRCTHCMACITICPTEAIEYGKKSVGQPRYRCPYEK